MKFLVGLFIIAFTNMAFASYTVVANKGFGATSISKGELKNVFNGSSAKFNSKPVTLAYLGSGAASEAFYKEVVGSSIQVFERTWVEKALSGAGTAPEKKATSQAVIDWVKANSTGIGFIESSAKGSAGDVQVLTVN